MENIERIKAHYNFTAGDVENLKRLESLMEKYQDTFVSDFYNHVKHFDDAHKYLKDDAIIKRHQGALKIWFMDLFNGEYGFKYMNGLEKVGMTHVKISLPAHYVNAAFHFVKDFASGILHKEISDVDERAYLERSVVKILDINLDIFTSSYIEEEKRFFLSQKVDSFIIQIANRFSHGLNLILVLGLAGLGLMVMGLFGYDLMHIMDGDLEQGILGTLGTMLMLWVVIELMDTEIKHLRGGKFSIKVFISVALVAMIREILVTSLRHDVVQAQLSLVAAVGVLGIVYWLIARVEK